METKRLLNKKITQWLLLVAMLVGCSANALAADAGFFDAGMFAVKYYDGGDKWSSEGSKGGTVNLGTKTTLYLKGGWVKTWSNGGWKQNKVNMNYKLNGGEWNYDITKSGVEGNQTWEYTSFDINCITQVGSTPGNYTIDCYYWLDGSKDAQGHVSFTIPGFSPSTGSNAFGNVNIGESGEATISLTHYGSDSGIKSSTITGTNADQFSKSDESSSSIKVKFTPTSAGSKTAKVTITDKYDKKYELTVTGTGVQPKYYVAGSFTNWDGNQVELESNGDGTYSKSITLTVDNEHKFKIREDEKWYGKSGGDCKGSINRSSTSIASLESGDNLCINADVSGSYTFTYTPTGRTISVTYPSACTDPTKAQSTMASGQSFTYNTQSHQPSVSVAPGAGAISSYSYSTDKSNWASTAVNVGTYYVKVNVGAGTTYCAANDIVVDNTFAITKADQAAFSISNETTTFCKSAAPTVTTTGGSGTGAVTFSKDSGTDEITVNESTGKITANNAGTITVKATKAGDTNYNVATATKTFTINAEPAQPGTISGNASPCINATGLTYSITAVATATGYTWTLPDGWSITSGAGTLSITATAGTAGGDIKVTADNDCGSSAEQTLAVTVKGKAISVSPTTVNAKKYTPTAITATTEGDVTWAVTGTNNYLLNADNTVYTSGNVKQVTVKAVSDGTVTATTINDGCETSATVTLTPTDDSESCN